MSIRGADDRFSSSATRQATQNDGLPHRLRRSGLALPEQTVDPVSEGRSGRRSQPDHHARRCSGGHSTRRKLQYTDRSAARAADTCADTGGSRRLRVLLAFLTHRDPFPPAPAMGWYHLSPRGEPIPLSSSLSWPECGIPVRAGRRLMDQRPCGMDKRCRQAMLTALLERCADRQWCPLAAHLSSLSRPPAA
jgi:hypothetical protein